MFTEEMMGMLQQGVGIVLEIAILAVLVLLRNLKKRMEGFYDIQLNNQQRQMMQHLAREAFAFAESVHGDKDGPGKLNEAVKYMLDRCEGCGLGEVHMDDMRAVIESAWIEDRRQAGLPIDSVPTYSNQPR